MMATDTVLAVISSRMTTDKTWVGLVWDGDAAGLFLHCSCAYFRRVYALSNCIRMFGL